MSKMQQVYATCPKCKSLISYHRAIDLEIERFRDTEKSFHAATAAMIEAGREEKFRRDQTENYLRDRVCQLEMELKELKEQK